MAPKWDYAAMPRDARTVAKYVVGGLALAAMLALAPFFFASGLMAPGWAVGVFIGVWLVLFGLGCVWIKRKPLWVVPLPFMAAAIWFGGMNAGAAWLGWTA
ncbi:MAG TPA: hypothetical protein VK754_06600 [Propionibacteriaceae bacterium]|nr:hypothetical protein [Propionibacteriaceae bacterium]